MLQNPKVPRTKRMPVAVRLVEALTLITIMGLITCIGLSVILTQHTISLAITFIEVTSQVRSHLNVIFKKCLSPQRILWTWLFS